MCVCPHNKLIASTTKVTVHMYKFRLEDLTSTDRDKK